MSNTRDQLLEQMLRVFPPIVVNYPAAPHKCLECDEVSRGLAKRSWPDVATDFLSANCDVLPLLSEEAYVAYLPAWIREALLRPDGGVATMVPISLSNSLLASKFTPEQRAVIVSAVREMCALSVYGADDPAYLKYAVAVERQWSVDGGKLSS